MAKNRFKDTLDFIKKQQKANKLNLSILEIQRFESIVNSHDLHGGGDLLSLDWNRFGARPAEDNRHAIRAVLLASLYARDDALGLVQTRQLASTIRLTPLNQLYSKVENKVREVLSFTVPAYSYTVSKKGAGTSRAIATCTKCSGDVIEEMDSLHNKGTKVAVILIDMQSTGDVGQNRLFRHKSVLDAQKAVLQQANALKLIVYDIVIDSTQAKENELARNQNRKANQVTSIQTRAELRSLFGGGCQVQHVPKPFFESFTGTDLDARLQNDGIQTAVVMGYDANVCVKNTIFGRPEITKLGPGKTKRTINEQIDYQTLHPNVTGVALEYVDPVQVVDAYVEGLLDRGYTVVTSRAILCCDNQKIEQDYDQIAGQ